MFDAGLFGWLAIESVLLNRILTAPNIASALKPTTGIQQAPTVVGTVAVVTLYRLSGRCGGNSAAQPALRPVLMPPEASSG